MSSLCKTSEKSSKGLHPMWQLSTWRLGDDKQLGDIHLTEISQSWRQTHHSKQLFSGISSVQLSHSVMPDSLRPHGLQHARPPCPSPIPGVHSNSCPLSQWCCPTISSFVISFSSCPQSFPASGSFQMSQLFHQVAKVLEFSASTSVLPMNT